MSTHPHVATIDRMTAALVENDRDALATTLAPDVVLHMVGPWPTPGDHHGLDGLAGAIGEIFEQTGGEADLDQQWCIAEGTAAAEWEHTTLRRNGRTFEAKSAFIYRFADDRIAEMWMISTAPAEEASFWQ